MPWSYPGCLQHDQQIFGVQFGALEVSGTKIEASGCSGSLRHVIELEFRETDTAIRFSTRKRSEMAIWKYFLDFGHENRGVVRFYCSSGARGWWIEGRWTRVISRLDSAASRVHGAALEGGWAHDGATWRPRQERGLVGTRDSM